MSDEQTAAVVQRYLDELGGDSPAEPIVRALLDRAVRRRSRSRGGIVGIA
jgi:RNA polymerase sigma-70 factor (ECF subfamily)